MEVHYCMTRRDAWRSNLYLFSHQPLKWMLFLLGPALWTWFCYWQFVPLQHSLYLHSRHGWWLPAVFLFYFCLYSCCIMGGTKSKINKCYPETMSEPMTATTLMPECLHDSRRKYGGNKTIIIVPVTVAWKDIREVVWHEGDIYFRRRNGHNFVPHTAFDDAREGQQFFQQAVFYWKAVKYGTPTPPEDAAVWPPAPRPKV